MSSSRLSVALQGFSLPDGRVAVFGPGVTSDLSALPISAVEVIQGFRPDHDALAAQGYAVTPVAGGPYAAAVVLLPRARAAARAMVADAAARVQPGGPIWVDGQKTDGIDPMLKDLRARVPVGDPVAKAHGRAALFANPGGAVFADWVTAMSHPAPGFVGPPGGFSADGIDPASALLAVSLPRKLPGRVADLGAGWGWLASQVLTRDNVSEVHLIEADHASLEAARANVTDPRAQFHWADATRFAPDRRVEAVVMNPPFHVGRVGDPALGAAFIKAAAGMLTLSGSLWMVANRHLPYEAALAAAFREVAEVGGDGRFKVIRAERPVVKRA